MLLCAVFFIVHGFRLEPNVYFSYDFMAVYSGARCMVLNCDSYDTPRLHDVFVAAGGGPAFKDPFGQYFADYPPTTFLMVMPVALLPWKFAHIVWMLLIGVSYSAASFCMAELCLSFERDNGPPVPWWRSRCFWSILLLGAFLAASVLAIISGQVSSIAIALAVVAVWCFLRNQYVGVGIFLFAVSLLLKPQVAYGLWLYFVLTPKYRRYAWLVLAVAIVLAIPAVLWISLLPANHNWWAEWHQNVVGVALPGHPSDPGRTHTEGYNAVHLQTIIAPFFGEPSFYDAAAKLITAGIFGTWFFTLRRKGPSITRDLYALAAIGAISLMPVYHRAYDLGIALLLVPPAVAAVSKGMDALSTLLLAVFAMFTFFTAANINYALWVNHHGLKIWDSSHILRYLVFARNLPILLLLITGLLLFSFAKYPRGKNVPSL